MLIYLFVRLGVALHLFCYQVADSRTISTLLLFGQAWRIRKWVVPTDTGIAVPMDGVMVMRPRNTLRILGLLGRPGPAVIRELSVGAGDDAALLAAFQQDPAVPTTYLLT